MRRSRITPRNHRLRTSNCELGVSGRVCGRRRTRPSRGRIRALEEVSDGRKGEMAQGGSGLDKKRQTQPRRLGAASEPVPRLRAAPARGRRPCTSRLRNRGVTGRRKPSGCRCTKTGVTAARLPRQARQPVPSQQRGPSRAHEADARKQQRRAAATVAQAAPFTSSAPAQHQR